MFDTRSCLSLVVVALLAASGCTGGTSVSTGTPDKKTGHAVDKPTAQDAPGHAQPDRKTGHDAPGHAQPDRKTGHDAPGHAQPDRKTGHDAPGHAQPDKKTAPPDLKKDTGTALGQVASVKNSPDGKNVSIEVLQPGEEKPRSYFVNYEPQRKGPNPEVVAAVRGAKVGDRVRFDWVRTGHGPAITRFEIIQKWARTDK